MQTREEGSEENYAITARQSPIANHRASFARKANESRVSLSPLDKQGGGGPKRKDFLEPVCPLSLDPKCELLVLYIDKPTTQRAARSCPVHWAASGAVDNRRSLTRVS